MMDKDIISYIISLEQLLIAKDETTDSLAELIADEFIEINYKGIKIQKSEVLSWLKLSDPDHWTAINFSGQMISPTVALLTYKSYLQDLNGKQIKLTARSSLWQQQQQQWRLVFHQETRLPAV
jgi:hypothetical protein